MAATKDIAAKGGRAVPAHKRSFFRDRKLAVEAGRKGGAATKAQNRSFYTNRELAMEAGRKGGRASAESSARKKAGVDG